MRFFAILLPAFFLLLSCAGGASNDKSLLAVTMEPYRFIVEAVAGDDWQVVSVVPRGSSPETFDLTKLTEKLAALKTGDVLWPIYDRNLHDVVEDAVTVTANIVLLEGNWLLSAEPRWQELIALCDDSVFIAAQKEDLRERLVRRKMTGGLCREEAERFFVNSDGKNVDRLMNCRHPAGIELIMDAEGNYRKP